MATPDSKTPGNGAGKGNGARPGRDGGNGAPAAPAAPGTTQRLLSRLPDLRLVLPSWAHRLVRPAYPGLAVLFDRDRFTLVEIQKGLKGGPPRLTHLTVHDLPGGSLMPDLLEPNVKAPAEVAARLGRALDALPQRKKLDRISLVLPDACARVALLTLRDIPRSRRQADEMIRWQIRKRVPFPLNEARMTVQRIPLADGSERVVVALALARVMEQYEQLCQSLDLHPGLVDLATFTLANLCLAPPQEDATPAAKGDTAVLNVADAEFSVLILRHGVPLFYRSKPLLHHPADEPQASRRELQRELATSATYYAERLAEDGASLGTVFLRVARGGDAPLHALVAEALGVQPRPLRPGGALVVETPSAQGPMLAEAAPALGVVVGRWG